MRTLIFILAASYLLGSIPFGYLLVRIFRREDVRRSGSGNIGATNVSRKSPTLGALTLILDAAKGFVSVQLAISFSHFASLDPRLYRTMAAAAHNPAFAKKMGIPQKVAKEFNKADSKKRAKKK